MASLISQRFPDYQLPKPLPKTLPSTETKVCGMQEKVCTSAPKDDEKTETQTAKKQSGYVASSERKAKPKASLDYSKFDHIEDSDDEARKYCGLE